MKESYHCGLSGEGALKFAKEKGFPVIQDVKQLISKTAEKTKVSYDDFVDFVNVTMRGRPVTDRDDSCNTASTDARERSGETAADVAGEDGEDSALAFAGDFSDSDDTSSAVVKNKCGDTVSAVARDANGNFACAVSTGKIRQNFLFFL